MMEQSRNQILYWLSVAFYTIVLLGVLLYLRFPGERFKEYCEYRIEKWLPGVSCTIAGIGYEFPVKIIFEQMRLTGGENNSLLFEDPQFTLQPAWAHLSEAVNVKSRAFSGNHSALIGINHEQDRIELENLQIEGAEVKEITLFQRKDKKIEGTLAGSGSAVINQQSLAVVAAEGDFTVADLEFELNTPLFQLTAIDLAQSSFHLSLDQSVIELKDGKISNAKIDGVFQGAVILADPLWISKLALTGNITPKVELFQGKEQLQAVVSGVQRRYGSDEIPFKVGGSINSPTFIFGK